MPYCPILNGWQIKHNSKYHDEEYWRKENENTPFDILLHRHKGLDDKDTSKLVLSLAIDYHPATELQLKSTP